jgi:hypothetical protein
MKPQKVNYNKHISSFFQHSQIKASDHKNTIQHYKKEYYSVLTEKVLK